MSAVVTVDSFRKITVEVPLGESQSVNSDGYLIITSSRWGGDEVAVFKPGKWEFVVITPNRGRDGRFVKRGR